MKSRLLIIGIVSLAGCQAMPKSWPIGKMKFGPPPPGYVKIVGEPVPGWTPADMLQVGPGDGPIEWQPLGPRPILSEFWSGDDDASGRVVSIAVDPTNGDIAYAASASGGMWKTTDGGLNWTPKTDELSILNHGCVTLDPSDPSVVYLGTGEYTTGSNGDGLFRSMDGGDTFERIAETSDVGNTCSKVIVDPTDPDVIHVTGGSGYAHSLDGGDTWQRTLLGACSDVAINPSDPSIVFVGRQSDGIYRSTDYGDTFVELSGGLPTSNVRRILLSVSQSNPDVIYTAIVNSSSGLRGFYRSGNGGDTWTLMPNTPNFPSPQGWYDCFVGVDPTDEDTVYGGGVFPTYAVAGVIKTVNGGASWTDITFGSNNTQLHPDQHTIAFGPEGRLWVGNDGGIWTSDDGGITWDNRNNRLTVTQNYNIAVHPDNTQKVMGGTQDNGTVARDLSTEQWPQIVAGDGGFLAYDFDEPQRRYTTYVGLTVYRLGPGGAFAEITGPWSGDPRNFIAPLVMDPNDSNTLLGGTNRIWRTTNASTGADWTAISTSAVGGGTTINAIAVGPAETDGASNVIYSGSANGRVYYTSDGSTWENRSSGLPGGGVSDIAVHPTNGQIAYVSYYREVGLRILRTDNAGLNWTDLSGSLPVGVTPRALAVHFENDPHGLYVGSGSGVWVSLDQGATWTKDGADFPNVNVGDLYIDAERLEITAGTYGRGAWRAILPDPCPGPLFLQQPQSQTACFGDQVTFTVVPGGDGPFTYQWRVNSFNIPGATDASYTVESVNGSASYDVIVTNPCQSRISEPAILTAVSIPQFTSQPFDTSLCAGDTLFVFANATENPTYQWYVNGNAIEGATSPFLSIAPAFPCLSGTLTVTATNACGEAISNPAELQVDACGAGDIEPDGDVDMTEVAAFQLCYTGQDAGPPTAGCELFDFDGDDDIDLIDWCSLGEIATPPVAP